MRKLKLESLQVDSFETTGTGGTSRGTVQGHADIDTGTGGGSAVSVCVICQPQSIYYICQPPTYDVRTCGDTQYFDCTFGCTQHNTCRIQYCWVDANTQGCEVK
ncbi:MAG TPA: hypothetical protein VFY65_14260 [Longimicrobium sp.]|nr:hypothetical protein [Longimicrobium sp.]